MKLCIYCAGGFGKEVFDVAMRINDKESRWDEVFFIDDAPELGDHSYLGRLFTMDKMLKEFDILELEVIIATGEPILRKKLYEKVKGLNLRMATLIDPSTIVSSTANIGEGVIITPFCSISSSVILSKNTAINTNTIIGHDITIGEHTVVSSFVNVGGACIVGSDSYLGMGVQIKEGLTIGSKVILGMGSVVFNNIPDSVIALGNPARVMRRNEGKMVFSKP
jgi:sugar O-acyltransferase (sialic acid O-acetyltransferase NeuD family)